jgi:hypothetical protein
VRLHVLHEPPQKSRFAGSYLTSQDDEAPTLMNPIQEAGIGLLITGIRVEKAWIRRYAEWLLSKTKVVGIHGMYANPMNTTCSRWILPVTKWFPVLARARE